MLRRSVISGAVLSLVTSAPAWASRSGRRVAPTPVEPLLLWVRCEVSDPQGWYWGQATSRLDAEPGLQCDFPFSVGDVLTIRVEAVTPGQAAFSWSSHFGGGGFLSVATGAPAHVVRPLPQSEGVIYRMSVYMDQDEHLINRLPDLSSRLSRG